MKRYIRSAQSIHTLSYAQVLKELKQCILHRDTRRMQELSISRWYDKALSELRKCMGILASTAIEAASHPDSVFNTQTTNMSYYDRFLNERDLKYMQEAKNLDGQIVYMTPDDYFKGAATIFGHKYTTRQLEEQRSDSLTPEYVEAMKNGDQFPLCFLDYANKGQEGLHRMFAARIAFGPNVKYPVLVITPCDQELWDKWELLDKINQFERYEFKDMIEDMERALGDWSIAPPEDIADQAKAYIESRFNRRGIDVTVNCKVNDYQGDKRLDVTLIEYNGHKIEDTEPSSASPWLGNMFDLDADNEDKDIDIDKLLDETDLSDLELEDFFFK